MRMSGFTKKLAGWARRPADELDAAALALVADAKAAARLRTYQNDANVAALTIERTRDRLDRWGWVFLFAGLAFTTVNVQAFVAAGAEAGSLRWATAWLVEPMVMGLMLVLLRGEQIANRYGEVSGRWVKITRWAALLITYWMNTALYWGSLNVVEALIHSVPVVLVFLAAESLVQQRLTLTAVVDKLGRTVPNRSGSLQGVPERPRTVQDAVDQAGAPQDTPDELDGPRTLKEQAYAAFAAICREGRNPDEVGPAEVDRRAGVRPGTSKVSGRMTEFRARWETENQEVSDGEAAG